MDHQTFFSANDDTKKAFDISDSPATPMQKMTTTTATTNMTTKATTTTRPDNNNNNKAKHSRVNKKKRSLTKEERRVKYTQMARERTLRVVERQKLASTVCYNCRQRGHVVADCPVQLTALSPQEQEKRQQPQQRATSSKLCYKCGSTEHSLQQCPQHKQQRRQHVDDHNNNAQQQQQEQEPDQEYLPFATCFVCKSMGHLASQCPENPNGIYIHGGGAACRVCGSNRHRAKACPKSNKTRASSSSNSKSREEDGSLDNDNFDYLLDGGHEDDRPIKKMDAVGQPGNDGPRKSPATKRRTVNF